jgi:hypothetical protein
MARFSRPRHRCSSWAERYRERLERMGGSYHRHENFLRRWAGGLGGLARTGIGRVTLGRCQAQFGVLVREIVNGGDTVNRQMVLENPALMAAISLHHHQPASSDFQKSYLREHSNLVNRTRIIAVTQMPMMSATNGTLGSRLAPSGTVYRRSQRLESECIEAVQFGAIDVIQNLEPRLSYVIFRFSSVDCGRLLSRLQTSDSPLNACPRRCQTS